jgi:hypothetical protein
MLPALWAQVERATVVAAMLPADSTA